jgi:hypothetical protein
MIPKKSDNSKAKRKSGSARVFEAILGSANFFDSVLGSVTSKRLKNTGLVVKALVSKLR